MAERVLIALGSNVGRREAQLAAARSAIACLPATRILAASRVEETAPFGQGAQGPYLNQMLLVATGLEPVPLLRVLQRIELGQGRMRIRRWGARTIDLDIVRYGERALHVRELVIPHPGLVARDFWQREERDLARMLESAA